jgi:hypothetical protein
MADSPNDLRHLVDEAKRIHAVDTARLQEMSDEDVVWLTRRNSLSDAYLAEVGRRQLKAYGELRQALNSTSRRLYWLNVVMTIYTVGLFILAVVAFLKRG